MQLLFVIIAALAPVAVALWYIFRKDSTQPEPTKWLVMAFLYGVISAPLSMLFSFPLEWIFGFDMVPENFSSIFDSFGAAFLLAAIPEEVAKFIMLWLLIRKNPYFDEKFDGIVYAVFIGMGFAGQENVLYLIGGMADGSWISTGIARALFSIPGHFLFAVMMGYYYSLYHFGIDLSPKGKVMFLAAPILAHGLFDGILFSVNINEGFAMIGLLLFLYFFNMLRKKGKERIERLMNQ